MTDQQRVIANLVAQISSDIRIKFGVVEGMTPTKTIAMAEAVESLLLDHFSQVQDVREITNDQGSLTIQSYTSGILTKHGF